VGRSTPPHLGFRTGVRVCWCTLGSQVWPRAKPVQNTYPLAVCCVCLCKIHARVWLCVSALHSSTTMALLVGPPHSCCASLPSPLLSSAPASKSRAFGNAPNTLVLPHLTPCCVACSTGHSVLYCRHPFYSPTASCAIDGQARLRAVGASSPVSIGRSELVRLHYHLLAVHIGPLEQPQRLLGLRSSNKHCVKNPQTSR
jgi:hypothetical protein